jgi:site-specific recombinase XerC
MCVERSWRRPRRVLCRPSSCSASCAVERCKSPRDRAIATLLVNTGLRIGECTAVDIDDVAVSARKGRVVVREGKGDAYREVALNAEAREALDVWTAERRKQLDGSSERALFVSRKGHAAVDTGCW